MQKKRDNDKKSHETRSSQHESQTMMEKKEILQWSKLFLPTAWTHPPSGRLEMEDVTDNRAPTKWRVAPDLDLTRAIEDLLTGKDPAGWLEAKLVELSMTSRAIADTVRLFRESEKVTPNWIRARTLYNTFVARYRGLYGYYQQQPSFRKKTK